MRRPLRALVFVVLTAVMSLLTTTPAEAGPGVTCNGVPWSSDVLCATFTPPAGPVGTFVRFSGQIPAHSPADWATELRGGAGLNTDDVPHARCDLETGGISDYQVTVSRTGAFHGSFRVTGGVWECHQAPIADETDYYRPGLYGVQVGCVACEIGTFRITAAPVPLAFTGPRLPTTQAVLLGLALLTAGGAMTRAGRRRSTDA